MSWKVARFGMASEAQEWLDSLDVLDIRLAVNDRFLFVAAKVDDSATVCRAYIPVYVSCSTADDSVSKMLDRHYGK